MSVVALLTRHIAEVKDAFLQGLHEGLFEDLAFIGNASSVYAWTPAWMVDIDILLFVTAFGPELGRWLETAADRLTLRLRQDEVDFELRIIEGPYKPSIAILKRPIVVAHLGVFTEEMYLASPPLKRWSWRKYRCERVPDRFAARAPRQPDIAEVLNGEKGVAQRLAAVTRGRINMREWRLPDFAEVLIPITHKDPNFAECCFAYSANCARNHCRGLGLVQADQLGNEAFFPWYAAHVFPSKALLRLMEKKLECRTRGFDVDLLAVQGLSMEYMGDLKTHLEKVLAGDGSRPS